MAIECLPSEARFQMLYYEQLDIAKMRIAEITTLREKLKVAEEAIAFATKPICMCFAGCPECDPTGIPTLKEALAKIREE